ncbi:iron chaperone [Caulobacter sp. NIBR2454]|uniref:iron chaperone n=1 Tax=Caulobacter sp. NIBR2454 TaxID=3015996 RepID=UPI0022B6E107|nr:DUF1801 domain-containing protein [Caulobacter sp. NIBR2454]
MVQSKAPTVDAYMETVEPDRLAALQRLRALCRSVLDGYEEKMAWGMPGYSLNGQDPAVAFNSQKRHIAFYAGQTAVERFKDQLGGIDCGKGCVRYSRPDRIDFAVVEAMLRDIKARGQSMS